MNTISRSHPSSLRRAGMGTGCLAAVVVVVVLLIVGGIFVYANWRGWAASAMRTMSQQIADESGLPAEQTSRIKGRLDTLAADFEAKKITTDQLSRVLQELGQGAIVPAGLIVQAREAHLAPSGLSPEEKSDARRQFARFLRGVSEGRVEIDDVNRALDMVSERRGDGRRRPREKMGDDEVRALVASLKAKADDKKIPDEDYEFNFADELDRTLDKALRAPGSAGPP